MERENRVAEQLLISQSFINNVNKEYIWKKEKRDGIFLRLVIGT